MADLPKPSVAELDRLEEQLMRLHAHKARLAPDDEAGARDIDIARASVQRAMARQAQALEVRREMRLLELRLKRLEDRLVEIEEVRKDPTRKLRYLKGPEEPEQVIAEMQAVKKRLAKVEETGPL